MFRPLTVLTRNRRIAFIIAAIVCVAGVSVSWYVMHENKQETTTKIPTLSFHKVLPPPNQPILATSYFVSNGTVLSDSQPGVIYASQWYKDDGNPVVKTNHTAVWPKPVNVKGANQVIVKFDTTVMPDIVIVNVYNRLQKNGGPVGKPTYSCATVQGQDSKSCELYTCKVNYKRDCEQHEIPDDITPRNCVRAYKKFHE